MMSDMCMKPPRYTSCPFITQVLLPLGHIDLFKATITKTGRWGKKIKWTVLLGYMLVTVFRIVSYSGCNHYGMAGYWGIQAEKEGLIGMAFTNTSPIMVPTRAKYVSE